MFGVIVYMMDYFSTFLEIVETRFGRGTHMVFAFYAFLCALLTGANVLLGSSTTIHTRQSSLV